MSQEPLKSPRFRFLPVFVGVAALALLASLSVSSAGTALKLTIGEDDVFKVLATAALEGGQPGQAEQAATKSLVGATLTIEGLEGSAAEFEAVSVRVGEENSEGLRSFWFDAKPFGEGSSMFFEGFIGLEQGPTGGHELRGDFALRVPNVDVLRPIFPKRIPESFFGPLTLTGEVNGYVAETPAEYDPAEPLRGTFKADTGWRILGVESSFEVSGQLKVDEKRVMFHDALMAWNGVEVEGSSGWAMMEADGKWSAKLPVDLPDPSRVARLFDLPLHFIPQGHFKGTVSPSGNPSFTITPYDLRADHVTVAGVGGWDLALENARFTGRILDPEVLFSGGVKAEEVELSGVVLGERAGGLAIKNDVVSFTSRGEELFEGDVTLNLHWRYKEGLYDAYTTLVGASGPQAMPFFMGGESPLRKGFLSYSAHQSNESGVDEAALRVRVYFAELTTPNLYRSLLDSIAPEGIKLLNAKSEADFPSVFSPEGTAVESIDVELSRRKGPDRLGSIRLYQLGFGFNGQGTFDRAEGFHAEGAFTIPSTALEGMITEHAWLAALLNERGHLSLPVTLSGPLHALVLTPGKGVRERLAAAAAGEEVVPFPEFVGEPVEIDVPDLPAMAFTG